MIYRFNKYSLPLPTRKQQIGGINRKPKLAIKLLSGNIFLAAVIQTLEHGLSDKELNRFVLKYSWLPEWRIFAGPAPDPMKDDGQVLIAGHYDLANISASDKQILALVPVDKKSSSKLPGIGKPDGLHNNFLGALPYPALNIRSLNALYPGKEAFTLVPDNTFAEINIRRVPCSYPE